MDGGYDGGRVRGNGDHDGRGDLCQGVEARVSGKVPRGGGS